MCANSLGCKQDKCNCVYWGEYVIARKGCLLRLLSEQNHLYPFLLSWNKKAVSCLPQCSPMEEQSFYEWWSAPQFRKNVCLSLIPVQGKRILLVEDFWLLILVKLDLGTPQVSSCLAITALIPLKLVESKEEEENTQILFRGQRISLLFYFNISWFLNLEKCVELHLLHSWKSTDYLFSL